MIYLSLLFLKMRVFQVSIMVRFHIGILRSDVVLSANPKLSSNPSLH